MLLLTNALIISSLLDHVLSVPLFFFSCLKTSAFFKEGKLEQLEYKDDERAGSCGRARRLLNAVADHSRGHTVCEITMPSIILSILGIYNVENPIQINKQTISS